METTGECIYPQEQSVDSETAPVAQDMTVTKKKNQHETTSGDPQCFLARLSKEGKRIAKAVHFDTDKRQVNCRYYFY